MLQLLWKGQEAFKAALNLIAAAEHACEQTDAIPEPFVWRQDILRPAADASQVLHLSSATVPDICLLAPCTVAHALQSTAFTLAAHTHVSFAYEPAEECSTNRCISG